MGQRANLVIVRRQDWLLYYDHWCANRLDIELFWGPRLAADFIEQREPLSDRDDWLDEVWCEGAAVLDEDRQALLWYGGEDIEYDVPQRRALLDLMKCQWQGWEIRWATGGIVEVGAYMGLPADRFLVDKEPEERFVAITGDPEGYDNVLTIRRQGRCLAGGVYGDEEALEFGSSQLPMLLEVAREPSLRWTEDMPWGGLHIDMDAHSLHYWRAEWLGDHFEAQLGLASIEIQLPHREISDLQRSELHKLRQFCTHLASNPAREIAAEYEVSKINPWTDVNRSSAGSEREKLQLLEVLELQVPIRHS